MPVDKPHPISVFTGKELRTMRDILLELAQDCKMARHEKPVALRQGGRHATRSTFLHDNLKHLIFREITAPSARPPPALSI